MALSTYLMNKLRDHVYLGSAYTAPADWYVACYTTPVTAGGGGTEVTGGSYARFVLSLVAGADGEVENDTLVSITSMPAGTVTHVGLRDASTAGNLGHYGQLPSPQTISAGGTFSVPIGDLVAAFTNT